MRFPVATGEAARLLGTTEPKLSEVVRRGRITPAPPVLAGRRLWEPDHLLQAATALGLLTNDLRRAIGGAAAPAAKGVDA
jgi:hypothetical protein